LPATVVEAGDRVVFAEADGTVVALRREDGLRVWQVRPGGPVGPGLTADADRVYVADQWGHVSALALEDGALLWTERRSGWGLCHVRVAQRWLFVAGTNGILTAYDAASGEERWRLRTAVRFRAAPAWADGTLLVADSDRCLLRLDAATGRRREIGQLAQVPRFVSAGESQVWTAGQGGVGALGPVTWSRWLGTELAGPPVTSGDSLLAAGRNGFLYRLDPANGDILWKRNLGGAITSLQLRGSGLVATTADGDVRALDMQGDAIWSIATGDEEVSVAGDDARLYLMMAGHLHAFDRARSSAAADTSFRESHVGGVKTGFGWERALEVDDELRVERFGVGWRHGFVQRRERLRLEASSLQPVALARETVEATQVVTHSVHRAADSLRFARRLGAVEQSWSIGLPPGTIAADALGAWLTRHASDSVRVVDLDSGSLRWVRRWRTDLSREGHLERLRFGEAVVPEVPGAADLSADLLPHIDVMRRFDVTGQPVETQIPDLGLLDRVVPADTARAWRMPAAPAGLFLDRPVTRPQHLDSLTIRLPATLGDARRLFVQDARQSVRQDSAGWSLTVRRAAPPEQRLPLARVRVDPALADYRRPSIYVPSAATRIRTLADSLLPEGEHLDAWDAARRLHDWVYDRMIPADTNVRFKSALEVLDDLEGTCSEYTVLFASLARAAGLPVRISVGFAVAAEGQLVLHIWPQVFVGEWVEVDPSWSAFPVEAAHIKTGQGLLHPVHLERLNMTLEWIMARSDTLRLEHYGAEGTAPLLARAEDLHDEAREADRHFDELAAQAARYELVALPWNRRSGEALVDIARTHLLHDELEDAEWALTRLRRQDPSDPAADAGLFYEARVAQRRGDPARARRLLEELATGFPEAPHADDALGTLARQVEAEEGCEQARRYNERLLEMYADSGWAAVARAALRRCDGVGHDAE
jgi:outer membrane protein assembly factor BamB/transglutaminase-like putative cysteine protease